MAFSTALSLCQARGSDVVMSEGRYQRIASDEVSRKKRSEGRSISPRRSTRWHLASSSTLPPVEIHAILAHVHKRNESCHEAHVDATFLTKLLQHHHRTPFIPSYRLYKTSDTNSDLVEIVSFLFCFHFVTEKQDSEIRRWGSSNRTINICDSSSTPQALHRVEEGWYWSSLWLTMWLKLFLLRCWLRTTFFCYILYVQVLTILYSESGACNKTSATLFGAVLLFFSNTDNQRSTFKMPSNPPNASIYVKNLNFSIKKPGRFTVQIRRWASNAT